MSTSGANAGGSSSLNQFIQDAPSLNVMQRSLAETILDYADRDNRVAVAEYCDSMSKEGLARLLRDLMMITPIARTKLMQK